MAKAIINGQEIFGNVHLGKGGDVANPNIADVYDPTQTYNTGDRRIYDDVLYVCNDDNVTGDWDSTKWNSATIDEIISALTAADISYSSGVSVQDMLNKLTDYVKIIKMTPVNNVTIATDTEYNSNSDIAITGIPTGYKVIGVCNVRSYNYFGSRALVYAWLTGDTTFQYAVYNASNRNDLRCSLDVWFLCIRNN